MAMVLPLLGLFNGIRYTPKCQDPLNKCTITLTNENLIPFAKIGTELQVHASIL